MYECTYIKIHISLQLCLLTHFLVLVLSFFGKNEFLFVKWNIAQSMMSNFCLVLHKMFFVSFPGMTFKDAQFEIEKCGYGHMRQHFTKIMSQNGNWNEIAADQRSGKNFQLRTSLNNRRRACDFLEIGSNALWFFISTNEHSAMSFDVTWWMTLHKKLSRLILLGEKMPLRFLRNHNSNRLLDLQRIS